MTLPIDGLRISTACMSLAVLAACASERGLYDLRPAYQAEIPAAKIAYTDCDGVSDLICECRTGGIDEEFSNPSRKHFDHGYTVLAAEIEGGATRDEAETRAVRAVFDVVAADVEDICTELE